MSTETTPSTLNTPKLVNRSFHVNVAQAKFLNANCKEMYNTWARGTGKTYALAVYEAMCMHSMPRCTRLLLGPSYRKMVTDLLPGMMVAWEQLGYHRDEHYVIGNSPIPKADMWPDPIYVPPYGHRQFVIHWRTGASQRIGSADRKVTLNGLSLDGISADELKLIPEDTFKEILKTNRANPNRSWSNLPEHNSIVGFTDKYWTRKGADWVMRKKPLANMARVNDILILQTELNAISEIVEGNLVYTDTELANDLIRILTKLRNETTAFFEASVYVNIPAVTPQFILQMKKNMPEREFRASMLNHDLVRNDEKEYFYPFLDENVHGYVADNFEKIDRLISTTTFSNDDCSFDTDCDISKSLEISVDWGGTINCMSVYQESGTALNCINAIYAKHPEKTKALAMKFLKYYAPMRNKKVFFYYDPSGNNNRPDEVASLAQEFADILRAHGWQVVMMSIGLHNNPFYELRFELFKRILQPHSKRDSKYPHLFFNRTNCKELLISMLDAGLKRIGDKIKKDKSSEKPKSGVLPEYATHFSDTVDVIIMHKYGKLLHSGGIPSTFGEM